MPDWRAEKGRRVRYYSGERAGNALGWMFWIVLAALALVAAALGAAALMM